MRLVHSSWLAVLAGAATVLVGGAASAAPSSGASVPRPGHLRIVPLAASRDYIVYTKARSAKTVFAANGGIFVVNSSANVRHLDAPAARYSASIVGHMLVTSDESVSTDVQGQSSRWWNLAEGSSGPVELEAGEHLLSAAPDGWVTYEADPESGVGGVILSRVSAGGSRTSLGDPFPDGGPAAVRPGPDGLLAWYSVSPDSDSGVSGSTGVAYMPWSQPGDWRTIFTGTANDAYCSAVTRKFAACSLDQRRVHDVLYPLSGASSTNVAPHCPSFSPAILRRSAMWNVNNTAGCVNGTLYQMHRSGDTKAVRTGLSRVPAMTGLRRLIVEPPSQRSLEIVSHAHKAPRILVRAD